MGGEPTHTALYSVVNEFEQCRAQALTLTKGLPYVRDMYDGIAQGLEIHGHSPTRHMFTDNASGMLICSGRRPAETNKPSGEVPFHESATQSLRKDVKHAESDDRYKKLPPLELPPAPHHMSYIESPDIINAACINILSHLDPDGDACLVIGFDIEYDTETTGQGGPGMVPRARTGRVDVIQLSCEDATYVFKASFLIFALES